MSRGFCLLLLLCAAVAVVNSTSQHHHIVTQNPYDVLDVDGFSDDDDRSEIGGSDYGDDMADIDDLPDQAAKPPLDYSSEDNESGAESGSESDISGKPKPPRVTRSGSKMFNGVGMEDAALETAAFEAAKEVVEQETPPDIDDESYGESSGESESGSPPKMNNVEPKDDERSQGIPGTVVTVGDSVEKVPKKDRMLDVPDGLAGSYGTSSMSDESKTALAGQCSFEWSKICSVIISKPNLFNDNVLTSWIEKHETSNEVICYNLIKSASKKPGFNRKEKPACYLKCLQKAETFRATFDHMCQRENDEWRIPSTGEMFLACRQDDLAAIVGAREDEPFEGPAYAGWDMVKDGTTQLSFAFEKESKSLSFLNFYKPIWFPSELWGKEKMCPTQTKRCVMPFCRASGDPKITPCVEPEWGYSHGPTKKDEAPWTYCKHTDDDNKTRECARHYLDSDRSTNGLIRVHACTHFQTPSNSIKCVLDLNEKLSWNWSAEEVEQVKTNMFKFYVQKAAKKCVMENLEVSIECKDRKAGASFRRNILAMYRTLGEHLGAEGLVELQENVAKDSCRATTAYMNEETFTCLNSEFGDYLGEDFFNNYMPTEGKAEALSYANNIFENAIRERRGRDGKAKDQDKIPQFKWLKYATPDVIGAIVDSYKYDDMEKEKERVEHFTYQSFSDYELFFGAEDDDEDSFYKYNRGRPMLGFLPDRLIHENSHSWELTHRKCTPTLGMLAGIVGIVQRGIIDSNNLHVHMVFPRAPSNCCACRAAQEVDAGIQCGKCTMTQCASNEYSKAIKKTSSNQDHLDKLARLEEESKKEVAMYRVNRLLAALACQLNDIEAVGKWYRSFQTRYLTVWTSEDATKLKSTLADGGKELGEIESKTGGHSWGTYKNAFTGFRAGIYGSDDLVGFEFRSLSARLPEEIKKDLLNLTPRKSKGKFYPMVRLLQRVTSILSKMSIEPEGDSGIKADGVIVKVNPFGLELGDAELQTDMKKTVANDDQDGDDALDISSDDADGVDDSGSDVSAVSALRGSAVDLKTIDPAGDAKEKKRLSKPIPLKVLDTWQEESRTVGMKYFGFDVNSPLADQFCPTPVVLVYDLDPKYTDSLSSEKGRGTASKAVLEQFEFNGHAKKYFNLIREVAFGQDDSERWQMKVALTTSENSKAISVLQDVYFREFCGKAKKRRGVSRQSPCRTTAAGVLPLGKPLAHIADLSASDNPAGCAYEPSTEKYYPLPVLNFINKIISEDNSISKSCAQKKWSQRVAKALVNKPDMSFDFWPLVDELRAEEASSDIDEEERIPRVNVPEEYLDCLKDSLNRVSFLTTNARDFETLAVAVSDENRHYGSDGLSHVMKNLFLNPYIMACTPEHNEKVDLDTPDAGDCKASPSVLCKQREIAGYIGKNRLWKKLKGSNVGQCLSELQSYQFLQDAATKLDPHFEL